MLLNIKNMRSSYNQGDSVFTEDKIKSKDPFDLFGTWFEEACKVNTIEEANATCLATATKDGIPSARYVLLKGYTREGFTFFTKYTSRKGIELAENPRASLCFYWEALRRSIRIEGTVEKVPTKESKDYFDSRPRGSQLAAHISCKSPEVVPNRDHIIKSYAKAEEEFTDKPVPRPENWGGYRIIPSKFEFWQGQTDRTHDRIIFRKKTPGETIDQSLTHEVSDGWLMERLAP